MKLLSCLFLIVISSCQAQTNLDPMIITYKAITRGSSIELEATSAQIYYKDRTISKEIKTRAEFWSELNNIVEGIDLSDIENLFPPSDKNTVDAALQATLSIAIGDKVYESQTFDHGNPPKELKPLLDKLFSVLNLD